MINWKKVQIICWTVFFIIGCFLWERHLFPAETENSETNKVMHPPVKIPNSKKI